MTLNNNISSPLSKLHSHLSPNRLQKYLHLANNELDKAIKLYELNAKYSAQLQLLLSHFEVVFRNNINYVMQKNNENWLLNLSKLHEKYINNLHPKIKQITKGRIQKVYKKQESKIKNVVNVLQIEHKDITNDNLIARMTFGFWTTILKDSYDELWNIYLSKIFNKKIDRNSMYIKINNLRELRNRIAHNESIINLPISVLEYYDLLIELFALIDVDLVEWIKKQMPRELFIQDKGSQALGLHDIIIKQKDKMSIKNNKKGETL